MGVYLLALGMDKLSNVTSYHDADDDGDVVIDTFRLCCQSSGAAGGLIGLSNARLGSSKTR